MIDEVCKSSICEVLSVLVTQALITRCFCRELRLNASMGERSFLPGESIAL